MLAVHLIVRPYSTYIEVCEMSFISATSYGILIWLIFALACPDVTAEDVLPSNEDISSMWAPVRRLGNYIPPDEVPKQGKPSKLPSQFNKRNFFVGTPLVLSPYKNDSDYDRAWPDL